jgi:STIP1 family protein 1
MQEMIESAEGGSMGSVGLREELDELKAVWENKINELRNVFAIADPKELEKRVRNSSWWVAGCLTIEQEIPEYLIDDISFEIMHDPVMTKHGHSYERKVSLSFHKLSSPLS